MSDRVDAILLARGGSKGIIKKNIAIFCGLPLVAWTILQAKKCPKIDNVWVSSDDDEILEIAESFGALLIKRPIELSTDTSTSEAGWIHALDYIESHTQTVLDILVAPQVTSPLREPQDFAKAIQIFQENDADSLLSVNSIEDHFIWREPEVGRLESVNYDFRDRKRRQMIEKRYLENGSFYLVKPSVLRERYNRLGGKIEKMVMERHKMFQIDDPQDLALCEVIMKGFGLDKL